MTQEELEIVNHGVHSSEVGRAGCHVPGAACLSLSSPPSHPQSPGPWAAKSALLRVSWPTSSHLALPRLHALPYSWQSRIQRPWETPEVGKEAAV